MRVWVSTHLRAYTGGAEVEVDAPDLRGALSALEERFPGIRFRIVDEQDRFREHITVFLNQERVLDMATPLAGHDRLRIVGALSGGARET